jgi:hypothetical protein
MKIFKNLLKLAKLSAIRPVFTSKTFYSAAISLVLMAPLQRRGWRRKKRERLSRLRALSELLFRRQAPLVYNSACHKLKLGIAGPALVAIDARLNPYGFKYFYSRGEIHEKTVS